MDELKKYIQDHKEQLDLDEPGKAVWERIAAGSSVAPVRNTGTVLTITRWVAAACVLVLAGIGTWYVLNHTGKTKNEETVHTLSKPLTPMPVTKEPVKSDPGQENLVLHVENIKEKPSPVLQKHKPAPNETALRELRQIENSFTQVINLQKERISSIPMYAESPDYFKDFTIQIRQMEKDEKVIKSDIARRGMTDALLDQLINLYQQKLNVLKQMQIEMNKTNNRYKQNRSPVDSARTYFLNL